jgi:2-methylcitrate dehydratase PrpD
MHGTQPGSAKDIAQLYAEFAHDLTFERLPTAVVDATKKLILDQLGVMLLGSSAAGVDALVETIADWGGKPESTVLVHGTRAPAHHAALVNGTMARALDYDAVHEKAIVHVTAGSLPQCLAVAERNGGVSGKDLIVAMAAGMELMIRLGLASETSFLNTGRVTTLHQANFGGALAAAKLMRLSPEQIVAALGIASGQVAGTLQMVVEGSVMVRVQQGFAGQNSVLAAVLAERGMRSVDRVFQGEFGYFRAYHDNKYRAETLTERLGEEFVVQTSSIKYYPCCFLAHFAIAAMQKLKRDHALKPDDVAAIHLRMTKGSYDAVCAPIESKRAVTNTQEALFSAPYTVATALVHGGLRVEHMRAPALSDPAVSAVASRVTAVIDPQLERQYGRIIGPSIVDVTLRDGTKLSAQAGRVKGHPDEPMSLDDCEAKFWSCAPYAAKELGHAKLETAVARVRDLEHLADAGEIVRLMS